jgi:hypothetical protein
LWVEWVAFHIVIKNLRKSRTVRVVWPLTTQWLKL